MITNIYDEILNSISDEWKTVPQLADELNENIARVNKKILQMKKNGDVYYRYKERANSQRGITPIEYMRVEVSK